jgi:hypothetical protein
MLTARAACGEALAGGATPFPKQTGECPMRLAMIAALTVLAVPAAAADLYPGARPDPEAQAGARQFYQQQGLAETTKPTIYSTGDPWEKVVEHYRRAAAEYRPANRESYDLELPRSVRMEAPGKIERVGSGIRGKQAFFILDGATALHLSSHWLMVTTPRVADVKATGKIFDPGGMQFSYGGVEPGVTVITEVEKR